MGGEASPTRIDREGADRHVPPMNAESPLDARISRWPVFPVACWVLGLMAFTQLLVAGMALATRLEDSKVVKVVEKVVPKPVVVRVPAAPAEKPRVSDASVVSHPPLSEDDGAPAMPVVKPTPLAMPPIADPRTERLVNEARQARVAGDMGKAVMLLEEALLQSPEDPSVHWEMGMVHEQMGVYDRAAEHYQKILAIGLPSAGSLLELAGRKMRDGFEQPTAMLGKMSLGRARVFNNPNAEDGQKVIVDIPVQKGTVEEIDLNKLDVSVLFFNKTTKGEIVMRDEGTQVKQEWTSLPFDWAGGEETLRMTYIIPPQDTQTEHLFGARTYYGQVVSLVYNGEVLDVDASPRDLAARIPQQQASKPGDALPPGFENDLPPDSDPGSLLPPKLGPSALEPIPPALPEP